MSRRALPQPHSTALAARSAAVALALVIPACGAFADDGSPAPPASEDATATTAVGSVAADASPAGDDGGAGALTSDVTADVGTADSGAVEGGDSGAPAAAGRACEGLRASTEGSVAATALVETSGLAASRRHPDIVWATNDSGQATEVHALGPGGTHRATFAVAGVRAVDIEDIAVADDAVYLADIGDNDSERDEIAVYRFAEPDPSSTGETIDEVEEFRLRYPTGARDAEALAVDPLTGDLIIVEKAFGFGGGGGLLAPSPATVFVAAGADLAADLAAGRPTELTAAGTVALDELATVATAIPPEDAIFTRLGLEGVATAADVRADGRLVAIRTYATVWLFERRDGETVAQALASTPCEAPTITEEQGEAVAFLDADSSAFVTVSEGRSPAWNVTSTTP